MSAISNAKAVMAENRRKAEAERAARRAAKAMEGTPAQRFARFFVRWAKRAFFTAFFLMFVYMVVVASTLMIPNVIGVLAGALGYTLDTLAEVMLIGFMGMFFVLWAFAITFFVVRFGWKAYVKALKGTKKDNT